MPQLQAAQRCQPALFPCVTAAPSQPPFPAPRLLVQVAPCSPDGVCPRAQRSPPETAPKRHQREGTPPSSEGPARLRASPATSRARGAARLAPAPAGQGSCNPHCHASLPPSCFSRHTQHGLPSGPGHWAGVGMGWGGGGTEAFSSFAEKRSKIHTEDAGEGGREPDKLGHLCCDFSF